MRTSNIQNEIEALLHALSEKYRSDTIPATQKELEIFKHKATFFGVNKSLLKSW
ncbi:hypothetical protein [uncultured Tenacibaculum sp.]|uniref:hypothetical protein n=1 Tax=uncultured Tenacibaculum sp. TaxID=174713 RepID=UPI002635CBDA|nr:hypothetical protein [uncultured Tenacibaculum sp.]